MPLLPFGSPPGLNKTGDTMTGDLVFPNQFEGIVLTDSSGTRWRLGVTTGGNLTTTRDTTNFDFMNGTVFEFMDDSTFEFMA